MTRWSPDLPELLLDALDAGKSPQQAAEAVGYTKQRSLASQLRRHGSDLANLFERKDPGQMTQVRWTSDTAQQLWLFLGSYGPDEVVEKLGYKNRKSLARQCYRHGHKDLGAIFERVTPQAGTYFAGAPGNRQRSTTDVRRSTTSGRWEKAA